MEEPLSEDIRQVLQDIEKANGAEEPLPPELEQLLQDLHPENGHMVRQKATEQLGELGTSHPRVVRALSVLKESDGNPYIRTLAAKSLQALSQQDTIREQQELEERRRSDVSGTPEAPPREVEQLLRVLQSGSLSLARKNAVEQLGSMETSSPQVVQALIAAREADSDLEVRRAAAKALRSPVSQRFLQQHRELEEEQGAQEPLLPEVERLLRLLQSSGLSYARRDAAEQLGSVETSSPRIVEALISACEFESDPDVRRAAARALRAPVHQEWLQQHPRLMQATRSALRREGAHVIPQQAGDRVGWVVWLLWVVASAAGLALGAGLERVVDLNMSAHMLLGGGTTGVLGGLALPGGLAVGASQWLVLRQKLDRAGWWWILASTPLLLVGQLSAFHAGLTVRGIGVGLAQWLVLRRRVPRAGWWIVVCAIGWTTGAAVGDAVFWEAGWLLANALAGAVVGSITGAGLVWLLRE